ncbi:MAG TPA: hypothetical protein VJG13_11495 [Thermoanaerobaculia bacterium]|nr:hypothetical protein [Thermoanaerobaculia bacterium]
MDVAFELAIPGLGVELLEPPSERDQLLPGERLHFLLDRLDLRHIAESTSPRSDEKREEGARRPRPGRLGGRPLQAVVAVDAGVVLVA